MRVEKCLSSAGVQIVAEPFLVEQELAKLAQSCSEDWLKYLGNDRLIPSGPAPVSLEILNGGKFYYCKAAWDSLHPERPCGLLQLRAKRGHASASSYGGPAHNDRGIEPGMELYQSPGSDWCVRLWEIPDDLGLTGPVLVGDTIATGTTLVGVLGWLVQKMEAAGCVQDVFVFTIVGASHWESGDGGVIEKLRHVDAALQKHGKELSICYCNATFGLGPNGTDLNPSPGKGADWIPEALEMLVERVGPSFPLADLKCGVWDWGDRFTKATHHLEEVMEHFTALSNVPGHIIAGLQNRLDALKKSTCDGKKRALEIANEQSEKYARQA